ncbi:MAG: 2-oxoglutarate and iron-dependent oxygenase domain-containing protein [Actinomycetota bacterium]
MTNSRMRNTGDAIGRDGPGSVQTELDLERRIGGLGIEVDRPIRVIDLADPSATQAETDAELWSAALESGFFQIIGHGIDTAAIDDAFEAAAAFFALSIDEKSRWAMPPGTNSGWEFKSQKRPSTGTFDQKETYQVTLPRMGPLGLWPDDADLPGFESTLRSFEARNRDVAMRVLSSFARKLGFDDEFFAERHDPSSPHYQSTLRLLHYLPLDIDELPPDQWRAGAHSDFDCLTLLHQREGQRGLQVCPGAAAADPSEPLGWTEIEPVAGAITCNIGDMLMRWSDDQLPSTLHRVRMPRPDEATDGRVGPRYSIAYFAQADRDAIIESPSGRHAPITAADYLRQRIEANFAP